MECFCDELEIGAMVIFGPKSSSYDVIIKVGKFVIEFKNLGLPDRK